ncbi:hypothetical protein SteCoe_22441 [Stentor coeruleus]|uniref:Ubiquitin carboxyl-terminal hydrolase n=1 Tax=Stentor coeruleus TaxID=5963 RepID=A0A1R2BMC4_9CILI|nr:hypothetical protein SteCoe_22441 [Stentor coeruleus]
MDKIEPSTVESWIQGQDDDVEKSFSSPKAGSVWYIISMKWLNKWREINNLKHDDMDLDDEPSPNLRDQSRESSNMDMDHRNGGPNSRENPPASETNSDIITDNPEESKTQLINSIPLGPVDSHDILDHNPSYEPQYIVKKGMRLSLDYEILPPKAWEYFKQSYGCLHEIKRYSIQVGRFETKVEINLKPVNMIIFDRNPQENSNEPKENSKSQNEIIIESLTFQVSIKMILSEFESYIKDTIKSRFSTLNKDFQIYLWKCDPEYNLTNFNKAIKQATKCFPGTQLKGNDEIQNLEIADSDVVICEVVSPNAPTSFKIISKQNFASSLSSSSKKGLTGLQNLGNTCFMNSGLQCLSNTHALTEYLLSGRFSHDINTKNRIGSGGKIINAYAQLIKEMWTGSSSSVSPWNLKKALGGFASQFIGYSQQDSQEMLSFLIDGIHEDLNQAPKPQPRDIEENGLSEVELAEKWWDKHKERNQSIIVDLMHGQYRSEVTCLECNRTSVAFDPFLMLTLPVPTKETMYKECVVINNELASQVRFEVPTLCKVRDLVKKLPNELKSENYFVGEYDPSNKDIRRLVTRNEQIDKHRDYYIFNYNPLPEDQAIIACNFSYKSANDNYGCGVTCGITRTFIVTISTLKDFHISIFSQIIQKIEEKSLNQDEIIERFHQAFPSFFLEKQDNLYNLTAYNPGRSPCVVCNKETCYGCKLPFSDEPLENYIKKIRDPCLFINIIAIGEKNKFVNKLNPLKYQKAQVSREEERRSSENRGLDLSDCIRQFEEVEELDEQNTIYCKTCKTHRRATKKMNLYKLPKYLIIHLKRFKRSGYMASKNGAQVDFPIENLIMSSHAGERVSYDLYAVSNHYGSMGGGHYTAYAKNVNGNWYDFNDSSVSLLRDKSSLTSSAAYVLFYKRSNL